MSNIVDLDELVPGIDGTIIKYKGEQYKVRGDLSSETIFEFLALYDTLIEFRADAVEAAESEDPVKLVEVRDRLEQITREIRDRLLKVFQLEHPDLEELPFGNQTTMIVLGEVLAAMGIGGRAVEPAPVPPTPAPRRTPKRASAKRATGKKTTSSRSKTATARRTPKAR